MGRVDNRTQTARPTAASEKRISARSVAFQLLEEVDRDGAYANLLLPQLLTKSNLSTIDKALATELAYGTLRFRARYDWIIDQLSTKPLRELDGSVVNVLRLGLHQLINSRIPAHAAASESVELTKSYVGMGPASFVNAILRSYIRQQTELDAKMNSLPHLQSLAIRHSHPLWIVELLHEQLKDKLEEQLIINNSQPKVHLAPWSIDAKELISEGYAELANDGLTLIAKVAPNQIPAVRQRAAGVQDIGSQWLSRLWLGTATSPAPLAWLDLCAGPGGKAAFTYHHLSSNRPQDSFMANELQAFRAELVSQVIPPELVHIGDGRDIALLGKQFDRILIDAPCSGLGALRRRPESRWRKSPEQIQELTKLQFELLSCAAKVVAPQGLIGYATCSPFVNETKVQVGRFLKQNPDFELFSLDLIASSAQIPSWAIDDDGHMQLWEYRDGSDDMFMAVLKRKS